MIERDRLMSADSHVNEPPSLWADRLPKRFKDRAPRIVREEFGDGWVLEGALETINFGRNCCAGRPPEEQRAWTTWDRVPAAGFDPRARVEAQQADGVSAEVLYPTPRIANQLFWHREDVGYHVACIQSYNDWLAEFADHCPDRLWGIALMPSVGIQAAIDEFTRVVDHRGIRGILLGRYPSGSDEITAHDDRLWSLAAESGTPVSIHVGFALEAQGSVSRMKVRPDMRFFDAPVRASQFIKTGVFDRVPGLALVLAEVDCGWIPYVMEQMDDRFDRAPDDSRPAISRRPSEYFRSSIYSTYITDTYGIQNRERVGVSQMMWSSDYPHAGSDWPHSGVVTERAMSGVPADERSQILSGNVARLYGG